MIVKNEKRTKIFDFDTLEDLYFLTSYYYKSYQGNERIIGFFDSVKDSYDDFCCSDDLEYMIIEFNRFEIKFLEELLYRDFEENKNEEGFKSKWCWGLLDLFDLGNDPKFKDEIERVFFENEFKEKSESYNKWMEN